MNAFEGTLSEVAAGFGTSGPFAQANAAVTSLGETLKAFVADSLKLPQAEINGPRARAAAQQAALAALAPPKALSDTQQRLAAIQGTAAGLSRVLQDLGMSAGDAATAIRDRTAVAMKVLRDEFSADLKARTNEAQGRGYLNEVADLVKEREGLLADARAIGAGTADVSAYFKASAQKIIDGSELTGDAFKALVRQFPALKGAVVEFGQAVDSAAAKAEAAARALTYQDRSFAAGNDTSTLSGALAAQDRKAAADRAAEQKAGGRAMADLEKALSDERTAIIRDFKARAEEAERVAAEATARRVLSAEDRLFAARNDTSTLTGKLAEQERQHAQERAEEVDAGGRALAKLEEAQAAERLKIVREAGEAEAAARKAALAEAQTFLDGQTKGIKTYLDGLKAGPETNLSPGDRLKEAQRQFDAQLKLAKGGDRDALGSITTYADRLLDAGKGQYASGKGYQDILGSVTKQLGGLPKQLSAEQFIVEAIKGQTTDLQATLKLDNPAAMAAAVHKNFPKLDINKDGLLSQTEFLSGLGPLASKQEQQEALKIFKAIDIDGDGQISKLEALRAALGSNLNGVDKVAKAVNDNFTKLDKDGSGGLSLKEFKAAFGPLATKADQQAAEAYFKSIDTDGDNIVTKLELARVDLLAGLKLNEPSKIASALKTNFPTIDVNSDGGITYDEYVKALGPLATKAEQEKAKKIFDNIDADGNNIITKMEAVRFDLLAQLKLNDPAKMAAALSSSFAEIDLDKDKAINLDEYLKSLGKLTAAQRTDAQKLFAAMDRDKSGTLTPFELAAWAIVDAVKANSATAFATALDKNFTALNTTVDGVLDKDELATAIKGLATAADQEKARGWIEKLDTNNNKQLSPAELAAGRLFDLKGLTTNTTKAVNDNKTATDTATTAVKDGTSTAKEMKTVLGTISALAGLQKTALEAIQGYQKTSDANLATAKETLGKLNTANGLQEDQLKILNKQYTLASPIKVAGTNYVLNNNMLDALNKIVFNTGQTVSGLIKLMSTGKPDGLALAFAEGGYTGPGGKYDAAGIVHRGEVVWSQADVARAGGVAAVEAMRLGANDNRFGPMPMPASVVGAGMDVGALLSELQALRAEVRTLRTENKAGQEMQARVTKAGADKVAGKVEETTDEVAGSREDARRDAAPMRAGRGASVKAA